MADRDPAVIDGPMLETLIEMHASQFHEARRLEGTEDPERDRLTRAFEYGMREAIRSMIEGKYLSMVGEPFVIRSYAQVCTGVPDVALPSDPRHDRQVDVSHTQYALRTIPCIRCGEDVILHSRTTADPQAPEMLHVTDANPRAWFGVVAAEPQEDPTLATWPSLPPISAATLIVACDRECLAEFFKDGPGAIGTLKIGGPHGR